MPDKQEKEQPVHLQTLGGQRNKVTKFTHTENGVLIETSNGVYEINDEGRATYTGNDGTYLGTSVEYLFLCFKKVVEESEPVNPKT